MRRHYIKFSALVVAILMVVSLGVTPVLAENDSSPVNIRHLDAKAKHRGAFEISFLGFTRFFRLANRYIGQALPFAPPSVYEPIPDDYDGPIFLMSKPRKNEEPTQGPSPSIHDGPDPVM